MKETELKKLFKDTELSSFEYEGFECAKDVIESIEEQINETEVIYYTNAIEYLSEHDASLRASLQLANDLGYSCNDLDSEKLATLLQQENLREELSVLTSDIEAIFEEV